MAPPASDTPDDQQGDSLAQGRSRRSRAGRANKAASAFEKLRHAKEKGEKLKYELEEEHNVYDVVDENEYSELVRQRQEDDWIIDDDGAGYVEDGREMFDEELDDDQFDKKSKKGKKAETKKNKNICRPGTKPKQDIKSMFAAAAVENTKKKPEKIISLENDELLGNLMEELHQKPSASKLTPVPPKTQQRPRFVNPFRVDRKPQQPSKPAAAVKVEKSERSAVPAKVSSRNVEARPTAKRTGSVPIPKAATFVKMEPLPVQDVKVEMMETDEDENDVTPAVKTELTDDDFTDIQFDEEFQQEMEEEEAVVPEIKEEPSLEALTSQAWEEAASSSSKTTAAGDVQLDSSTLPLLTNEEGEKVLCLYWLDAYEDPFRQPGTVYLFGKVWIDSAQTHVSCCVVVRNVERRLFLLPRATHVDVKTGADTGKAVSIMDVYREFNDVADKYKIMKFKSQKVSKNYAFELEDVPVESDYLEVRYSADHPQLPRDLKGATFSHVFGTNTSSLELLLLDRRMKGPCWLDIQAPEMVTAPLSWCKVEVSISKTDAISVIQSSAGPPPPLTVMTLNLRTAPNPKTRQHEIVLVSSLVHNEFRMDTPAPKQQFQQHFCLVSKPHTCIFPYDFKDKVQKDSKLNVEIIPTERALLGLLLAKIHKLDPDIIVGHDIFGFDLDVILHRISANKVPHWSKMSRLKRTNMPRMSGGHSGGFVDKSVTCGRLLSDVKISARELIRSRSYDLTELASVILKVQRVETKMDDVPAMYSSSQQLCQLLELALLDATYILRILYELNVLPLALQITTICGNVLSRTLMGGRSERNEYLLLHAFHEKNFIVPDKEYKKKTSVVEEEDADEGHQAQSKKTSGRKKPSYTGGLVLDPKRGFYDKFILLLDFNSLYPSIIQEYNICFTTISHMGSADKDAEEETEEERDFHLELPDKDLEPGILPTEIRKLVESRRQVKQLMKASDLSKEQYMQYDIRQKALKLTANSMYGCLGFTHSRFYARPLAALITGLGRETLMKTRDLVQAMSLDVIYGDTDSIMINTNSTDLEQVFKLGNKIKGEVNKLYRCLEIDIDGVFKSMLLLKKKKYAALSVTQGPDGSLVTHEEMKGLDIVRRDWCDLAKETGKYVVRQILSGEQRETILDNIHTYLQDLAERVNNGQEPIQKFHITKQLTKNPEDYPDKKSLPHVQVALRFNSKGGKRMRAGDVITYIVCQDGSNLAATQRVYHPEELAKSDSLVIDTAYYLAHQVHPVVARLCDPIEGTDAAQIAECLGLDPSGYHHSVSNQRSADDDAMLGWEENEEAKYENCQRFPVTCPNPECQQKILVEGAFYPEGQCVLEKCTRPGCETALFKNPRVLQNHLTLLIRQHIHRYYQGWLWCEDSACGARTRQLPLVFHHGHPVCSACHRGTLHSEYTDADLYNQLCFYQYIFDLEKSKGVKSKDRNEVYKSMLNPEMEETYQQLKNTALSWLKTSAFSEVNLNRLFDGLAVLREK